MSAEVPGSTRSTAAPGGWRPWLRVALAAGALLLLSEAIWLWQTWPVRELLQPVPATTKSP
ncbi:hypothetical protein H8N03_02075 [Ramlibacter sp. USB13]|uniref:Uncharacterized protein n=1 Tax=Ramlibacter cellulosilyticus TaxID=2764187 RepID=A0A923MN28_9BURK|nr:hypothetical protein [Ramlibacter cellulosilyticus]MBC5781713.1 hypothetical protein [Ramlibacter cellulosilyticus]